MIDFGMKLDEVKGAFFDAKKVLDAADRAETRVLSAFGAYVRQKAKGLIRTVGKKGAPSKPGNPPKSRVGLLRQFIFFSHDGRAKSVVIGPTALNSTDGHASQVLEEGGDELLTPAGKHGAAVHAHYKARPYMHPAFSQVEREDLPGLLNNSVR